MREPRRWRDDPTSMTAVSGTLLRGARRPQSPGARDLERLGAAVEGIARAPIAPPPSWLRVGRAAALAFVIVGGGTFVGALHARDAKRLAESVAAVEATEPARAHRPAVAAAPAPAAPEAAPVPARAPAHAARSNKRHVAEARVAAPVPAEATPTDSLAREVPLIDAGRAELASSPSRALATLETHRREFPRGQLAAEREFLAVQALVQMNYIADAKKRAGELATRYPASSYAARATRLIEDVEAQRVAA